MSLGCQILLGMKRNNLNNHIKPTLFSHSLPSFFVIASGMVQNTSKSLLSLARKTSAGVITTKSITIHERSGNHAPTTHYTDHYMLNAIGIPSAGIDVVLPELETFIANTTKKLAISVYAEHDNDALYMIKKIDRLGAIYIELNFSCPNISHTSKIPLYADAPRMASMIRTIKQSNPLTPIVAKLSPLVPNMGYIAETLLEAGIDGFTLTNTIPAMTFDLSTKKPVLSYGSGGMSGAALHPIALKAVHDVRKISSDIPIIGTGGVYSPEDAMRMRIAGASLIGIGSILYTKNIDAAEKIIMNFKDPV